jgi:transposase-like protein
MKQYPDEFKASIITKLLAPNNADIPALAIESGIPKDTLYTWRIQHRRRDQQVKAQKIDDNSKINSAEKFDIVIETAHMNQAELSAYCRSKGLYSEQIDAWRTHCRQANATLSPQADRKKFNEQTKEIQQLKSELNRKEKALAEAATLLILKKKAHQIWGDAEDN